jgi:hypothetical protein
MAQIKISGNHWCSLMSVHCFQMFLTIEDKYIYFDDCGSSPRALTLGDWTSLGKNILFINQEFKHKPVFSGNLGQGKKRIQEEKGNRKGRRVGNLGRKKEEKEIEDMVL